MDFCERYAGGVVLVVVAITCGLKSSEYYLVCIARARAVILKAKRDALLGLPKIWRKRREVQSRRVERVGEILRVLSKRWF